MSEHVSILVIGGGPAGSTVATLLAREGLDVMLVEREVFPRYHVGESLLPSALELFDLLGVRDKIEAHGFRRKPGGYIQWGDETWSFDFGELRGNRTYSFQVVRSELDHLLLEHAKTQGVKVLEGVEVQRVVFEDDRPRRAVLRTVGGAEGDSREVDFDFVVDASGRSGVLSNRQFKNRTYHETFQNMGVWGYWNDVAVPDDAEPGAIVMGSTPESWIWGIPLHDGTMSVGVVMHKTAFSEQKKARSVDAIYADAIAACPLFAGMLATAELVSPVKVENDYSYAADAFAGPGYFLCGDAACFLDPLLSSGVHLAMLSGMIAAASIVSVQRGDIEEADAAAFYEKSFRLAYTRFMVFVSVFYQQYDGRDSFFWAAQRLSRRDASGQSLKHAFLRLVSGVEDLEDTESARHRVIGEMEQKVSENFSLRRGDKRALHSDDEETLARVADNGDFFHEVEGLVSLSPNAAVDGLYVATHPGLHLARG